MSFANGKIVEENEMINEKKISDLLYKTNLNFMIEVFNPKPNITIERLSRKYCDLLAEKICMIIRNKITKIERKMK